MFRPAATALPGVRTSSICHLPYAHLNLRRNPFGEFSEEDRTVLAQVDVGDVVSRLSEPGFVVQYVGEKGYGKTTHLLSIRSHFDTARYVHIAEGERGIVPSGCPILIDEAQRLTLWQRMRLFRSRVPLVLGTHRDFSRELRRAGRVLQTIQVEAETDVNRLHQLLNTRILWVRRNDGPLPSITRSTASSLLQRFGPNIRGILHELYEVFQNQPVITDV